MTGPGGGGGTGPGGGGGTGPGRTDPATAAFQPQVRIGEVIRDVERLIAQAQAVVARQVDPASLPADERHRSTAEVHLLSVDFHLLRVQQELAKVAELPLPAVGSAVRVPSTRPAGSPGEEPTPGYATAVAAVVRESPGALVDTGAGDSFRPYGSPEFLPGTGERTRRIGGKHRHERTQATQLPPSWPLPIR